MRKVISFYGKELHPSLFTGTDFNSACLLTDSLFMALEDGVYEFGGSEDVYTGVIFPASNFSTWNNKRFSGVYITGDADEAIMSFGVDGEEPVLREVEVNRVKTSKDEKGREWDLKIAGFKTLEAVEIMLVHLPGRRYGK